MSMAGGKERWSGKSARAGEREGGIGRMGGSGSDPATVSETHAAAQNRVTRGHRDHTVGGAASGGGSAP